MSEPTNQPTKQPTNEEVLYVSWGGAGRAATVRQAMIQANAAGQDLVYLAILDDSTFGDIDEPLLELAKDELGWLLDAQLDLTRDQANVEGIGLRVLVRSGDVADQIVEVVATLGQTKVLIGAPIPENNQDVVSDLIQQVERRANTTVSLIEV